MARKRFNRTMVCSSTNYESTHKAHLEYLKEKHAHFSGLAVSGEIAIDVPVIKGNSITPKFKTIRVFGKEMKVTIEEYNTYCNDYNV